MRWTYSYRTWPQFPWATLIINVLGSFLLGLIVGFSIHHHSNSLELIAGTGFCGGFTTFSTACFESIRLFEEKRYIAFWLQLLGNVIFAIAAAGVGIALVLHLLNL